MRNFGVIGKSLNYSFSPQYFKDKFNALSIDDCSYKAFELFSIDQIEELIRNKDLQSDPNQEFRQVLFYIQFKNLKTFLNPMKIKDHINNLSFIDKEKRKIYGLYFQGGVCKINKQSFDYIIGGSN